VFIAILEFLYWQDKAILYSYAFTISLVMAIKHNPKIYNDLLLCTADCDTQKFVAFSNLFFYEK